uniref:Heat shock protein 70 n=1 Tax=Panagrolaimus sp. PS1159 TaxID=55785 RepID=A0AC35F516_9BILA
MAGLNVLQHLNEPTAAAIAYGTKELNKKGVILVYDLGGETFDFSIIKVKDGEFVVLAINGDPHLGGEDFDQRMVDYFLVEHRLNYSTANPKLISQIKKVCESEKRSLTKRQIVSIEVENGDNILKCNLTQQKFTTMCQDLFLKTLEPVKKALKDAKLNIKN